LLLKKYNTSAVSNKYTKRIDVSNAMYARTKTFTNKDGSKRTYIQIVESVRDDDKVVRQRVLLNLGRIEELQEGSLDRLIASLAKFSKKKWLVEQE
jgi:hypothetical protein